MGGKPNGGYGILCNTNKTFPRILVSRTTERDGVSESEKESCCVYAYILHGEREKMKTKKLKIWGVFMAPPMSGRVMFVIFPHY